MFNINISTESLGQLNIIAEQQAKELTNLKVSFSGSTVEPCEIIIFAD